MKEPNQMVRHNSKQKSIYVTIYLNSYNFFWDKVLGNPGWPGEPCSFAPPVSTSQVLSLQVCTTMSNLCNAGDQTQGFRNAGQAQDNPWSYFPSTTAAALEWVSTRCLCFIHS